LFRSVYEVEHDACIIENDGTEVQIAPKDVQFQSAKIIQRMLTNFAGPMNNFILAIVAFLVIALVQGGVASTDNQIGKVQENSVAQKAGIKPNDRIIVVGNIKTTTWQEASTQIQRDRKSTRLNSSHVSISYAVFCLNKKKN